METTKLREDVPTLEDAFVCRITCTECMEEEFRKMSLLDCSPACVACMREALESMT